MNRTRSTLTFLVLLSLALGLRVVDANPAVAQTAVVGAWRLSADPGLDGTAESWQSLPPIWVGTTPQMVTAPMGGGEVPRIAVRAGHWDNRLFVMLEWSDSTADVGTLRVEDFADAAAVQFPAVAGSVVPALCMGQADQAVNIWHWRADSQKGVPTELGYVDMYPSTEDTFYTARAAGNPMAAGENAVQNLLAGGFGTLTPADEQVVVGRGVHENASWTVVFSRPMDPAGTLQPSFTGQTPIDTAFAVWNGSLGHRNGVKSVSSFIQIRPTNQTAPGVAAARTAVWVMIVPLSGAVVLGGLLVVAVRDATSRRTRP